jgi:hypothetical protein
MLQQNLDQEIEQQTTPRTMTVTVMSIWKTPDSAFRETRSMRLLRLLDGDEPQVVFLQRFQHEWSEAVDVEQHWQLASDHVD